MSTIHYFAYGSNMSTPRLRYRVPGCRFEFVARLPNYKLCFHKRSKDGSAKCNAFRTAEPTDAVIGVVYEIPTNEKPALDRAEGLGAGYHEEIVPVLSPEGEKVTVHAYIADASFIDDILQPPPTLFVVQELRSRRCRRASATRGICRKPDRGSARHSRSGPTARASTPGRDQSLTCVLDLRASHQVPLGQDRY
jgi:hypothetical protein